MKPVLYKSPISLPEARSGSMQIRHKIIQGRIPIVGARQAILRGLNPVYITLTEPLQIHELVEDETSVWMTDRPEELNQIGEMVNTINPKGNCLVGGLGLGILAECLRTRRGVETVTVVERSPDVINLCWREGDDCDIHEGDITQFLQTCSQFDHYFLDTWQETREATWWTQVMPLRRIIANRFGIQNVWCWAEDIMLGQCKDSATRQAGLNWFYEVLPKDPSTKVIQEFFDQVGLPDWEEQYGEKMNDLMKEFAEDD